MLIAAKAMEEAMDILKPLIAETGAKPIGTFVMGTVKGRYSHDRQEPLQRYAGRRGLQGG
jgi:methanogenic corrinoid protein MtbC1